MFVMLKRLIIPLLASLHSPVLAQEIEASLPPAEPETVEVVLETTMGDIIIALETERAPITAGNFLRYVEEDRFDGVAFYRAMHLNWGDEPTGLLQGGAQMHPDRIRDPIAHEPTTETGLSHTDGALSMARYEPGTATGDFSIMIGNQKGLDANPKAEDPEQRPGFAVFGHVVAGMDVVKAIWNTPRDPEKGEGWMKGQLLAEPVTITEAKVVDSGQPEPPASHQ